MKIVYSDKYYVPEAAFTLSTRKQKEVMQIALEHKVIKPEDIVAPEPIDKHDAKTTHTREYVKAVMTGKPLDLAQSQGFTWSLKFRNLVLHTCGGQVLACELAKRDGVAANMASGAHHASAEHGGGFCTFNFLVMAPRILRQKTGWPERTMIVDLDAHQGNGTYELTKDDRHFYCFDISKSSFGVPQHSGVDGYYEATTEVEKYFKALNKLDHAIRYYRPNLIEYQAGMDCYEHDMMGAVYGLDVGKLLERDKLVFELCRKYKIPVAWNLAGGYVAGITPYLHARTVCAAKLVFERQEK